MTHLFPRFLSDESEYARAEAFWAQQVWAKIPEGDRMLGGWRPNWFPPQPPKDGNPIFSAVSETQHKGVRVIQYEPAADALEFDFWLDSFGGEPTAPGAIRELVIACALSMESARKARDLMSTWVSGEIELANAS